MLQLFGNPSLYGCNSFKVVISKNEHVRKVVKASREGRGGWLGGGDGGGGVGGSGGGGGGGDGGGVTCLFLN